ncbi:acetyl-lysine deacetylase [Actinoplanes sp. NBRC 14428]|uniref:Acetylornithine deacetylase n=1 Tax=Pseudosporangium ferrugineum TaxID=439699 RepID=A0A2T0RLP1_9ACTN|nr:M20/M25/M40 family metallo-hydrolase [Pseudosporangium ferrugineum]PRY22042.1 acetylornithine deacetylase [Pseudosporangium ferrugineum]BCJ50682.1 acetyl-lysine deacetylase [Actinoplanes sp. NBRC 14428]
MTTRPEIALLYDMVSIASPSGREQEFAAYLAGAAERLGLRARLDDVGNLLAETGTGDGPTVLLLSHLDTVDDWIPARLLPDRVAGRGAVDAKGPLATMLLAAAARPDFPGRLVVAGAVEEEVPGSLGATHLRATLDRPDAVVIGEPTGWDGVVLGYKGILDLSYRVRCAATHPTNPVQKASEAAAAFWADLVAALGPEAAHTAFDRPAATLTRISGTLTEATLDAGVRLPPGFDTAGLLTRLRAAARGGEVEVLGHVPAARAGRRDPVVRALTAGIRRTGGTPRHLLKTATSDMNTLAEVWDVPMAAYGPGDSRLDHADDEHLPVDTFLRGIAVLTAALDELAYAPRPDRPEPAAAAPLGGQS